MKKNVFLAILLMAFGMTINAQQQNVRPRVHSSIEKAILPTPNLMSPKGDIQYRMTSCVASDGYENYTYTYDNDNRIVKMYYDVPSEYQAYDTIYYNAEGRMSRISEWQLLNGTWTNVNYIDYTYDNQGRLSTRTNYNFFGGVWEMGGIFTYHYNEEGQLVLTELVMGNELYQTVEYQYENGRMLRELWNNKVFGGSTLELSEVRHYFYEDNQVIITDTFVENYYNGKEVNTFDGVGNCVDHSVYDAAGGLYSRSQYEFESRLVENTALPMTPEETRPMFYNNYNTYTIEHLYMLDVNYVLQHVCDFHYTYSDLNGVGIELAESDPVRLYPNPARTHLSIEGPENLLEGAMLTDNQGRTVAPVEGTEIDLTPYAPGLYFLHLSNGQNKPVVIVR